MAAAEANQYMLTRYDAENPAAIKRLLAEGVQIHPFPDDVMQAAREAATEILEAEATDPAYTRLYDAYKAWRADAYQWFGTAEQAYAAFAYGTAAGEECVI